ncbi:MAG TPA: sulfate permease [Rhodocyclaceae bacterium]|nr:sulfate permease [Rhodocyclaceae bacterium]
MIQKFLPFLSWFPPGREQMRADLVAGITVALVLVPQSMAYAQLAGLPAYYGLYAAFLPGIVAALWGSSKLLSTGPVAVVSLLTASALAPLATLGSDKFIALAILLAMMVGIFQLALGLLRLGAVVNFLSHPVIVGFTNAAALIIGLSQLNKLFGVPMPRSGAFLEDIVDVLAQAPEAHLPTLVMGLVAIGIMVYVRQRHPKLPGILIAVIVTTLASYLLGFADRGGAVVGAIPAGLPSIALPALDLGMAITLLTSAMIIALVGFMEAISIAKAIAARTRERIDPNQELIGQGLANIVGSLTQSYPVSGSFSRSAVNLDAGGRTGMSAVIAGLAVLVTLLVLTPLLYHLPNATLAAVIMMAVLGLINFKAIGHAWQANRHDGVAAVVTFVATLGFAPHLDKGILAGAGLAIVLYLYRTMHPRVAILGRFEDGTLRDLKVHPDLPTDPRIIAVRFDGRLYFANVSFFEDAMLAAVAQQPEAKFLLVVGDGINELDASGEEVLHHLVRRLKDAGVTLVFSGLKRQVLEVMYRTNLYEAIGAAAIHATEEMAIDAIYEWLDVDEADGVFCPLKRQPQAALN